ncbi:MAG: hypothetical protein AMXMBFR84_29760 [Candidatus Hydrogenedentota bacterium]
MRMRIHVLKWAMPVMALAAIAAGCATTGRDSGQTSNASAGLQETALDRYVHAPDPNYSYRIANTIPGNGCKVHIVEMTSQQYLTSAEVDRPIWKHWQTIVVPDNIQSPVAFLLIGGGSNESGPPEGVDDSLIQFAVGTGSVVSELRQVPNQPLIFANDNNRKRSEDEAIAYTWDKFLRTGDEKWPMRLPMTKSAVKALDTITAVCASEAGGGRTVDKFVVAGGSKRGWTTWTTAAVDKRVVAAVPIVIDLLNIVPSFMHHWEVYGFWAPAVGDYNEMHIMDWMGTKQYEDLLNLVEPYSYRARYTMPKYIVNSTGDQFFLPDSSQFYFDDLPGEKHLRYVPNTDHGVSRGSDAMVSIYAFYESVVKGTPRPRYEWSFGDEGMIHVKTIDKPISVKLWQATNQNARDFRRDIIGEAWTSTDLDPNQGEYNVAAPKPPMGWTAYFVEMTFPGSGSAPFIFTTGVRVIPDTKPYEYTLPKKSPLEK